MKDIDFDELDRAVNSLMATAVPSADESDSVPAETIVEVPVSSPTPTPAKTFMPVEVASSSPQAVTSESVTLHPESVPVQVTSVPQIPKRSGRFMDMVHTSSDMKPRSKAAPSREGLTIAPRPELDATSALTPDQSTTEAVTLDTEVSEAPFTTMPDPIEMAQAEPALVLTEQPESSASTEVTESPDAPTQADATAPSTESPFIADAKVEKRPLNAGASLVPNLEDELLEESLQTDNESDGKATSTDEPPELPQIPELNSDLVAIESSDEVDDPEKIQAVETENAASQVDAPAPPLGATSIPQQYTKQPSTGDQSHAAIYDATEYPEPLAHPAKKKSGWLWVLWVVLLLGVGAGGAFLLYHFGIIP